MFSTLTASTGLPLTLLPVSGFVGLGFGSGSGVADGVGVGEALGELTGVDWSTTGAASSPPRVTASPTPAPASTSAVTAATTV